MTKNGSFMSKFNAKGSGKTKTKLRSLPQGWNIMEVKLCGVGSEINAGLFTLSFQIALRHSMQTLALNSCNMSINIFKENAPQLSIEESLCFPVIRQGYIKQESRRKHMDLGWSVLPYLLYLPYLVPSNFYVFISLQNTIDDKNSPEDQVLTFEEKNSSARN